MRNYQYYETTCSFWLLCSYCFICCTSSPLQFSVTLSNLHRILNKVLILTWHKLLPLSIESRIRTIYPMDWTKCLVQNSKFTVYDRHLKISGGYKGWNDMSNHNVYTDLNRKLYNNDNSSSKKFWYKKSDSID